MFSLKTRSLILRVQNVTEPENKFFLKGVIRAKKCLKIGFFSLYRVAPFSFFFIFHIKVVVNGCLNGGCINFRQ